MIFKKSKKQHRPIQSGAALQEPMIFNKVQELLVKMFDCEPDEIHMKTNIESDLDGDSLDIVELVTRLEDIYGIQFSEDIYELQIVGDIVRYIEASQK